MCITAQKVQDPMLEMLLAVIGTLTLLYRLVAGVVALLTHRR
jgi:membrane-bound ClpP family serine protease